MDELNRLYNVILDKYIESCVHYSAQLKKVEGDSRLDTKPENRLNALIVSLESIENTTIDEQSVNVQLLTDSSESNGQNIIPTKDTINALKIFCDDILERLDNSQSIAPRNLNYLKILLKKDVLEMVSHFPSFKFAWDKIVEVSRLTTIEDPNRLIVRDTAVMGVLELYSFLEALENLSNTASRKNSKRIPTRDFTGLKYMTKAGFKKGVEKLISNKTYREIQSSIDHSPTFEELEEHLYITKLLTKLQNPHEASQIRFARDVIDEMALFGLRLAFCHWCDLTTSAIQRKLLIKSLLYYSRIFLEEKDWYRAVEFNKFSLSFIKHLNEINDLDKARGTPMIFCNLQWARLNLGHNITDEMASWDVSDIDPRYKFLKYILLGKYVESLELLDKLIVGKSGTQPSFSLYEIEEWPILEKFRESDLFKKWNEGVKTKL